MKSKFMVLGIALLIGWVSPAAAFSKSRLEKVQARAAADQKLIAFVTMQDIKNGSCPKDVQYTGQHNGVIKRAIPRKGVVVVDLDSQDLAKDGPIPEIVRKAMNTPGIVIANADCTQIIESVNHKADKARIAEMESKIAAASTAR